MNSLEKELEIIKKFDEWRAAPYVWDDIQTLEELQLYLEKTCGRTRFQTIKWKVTEEAVLLYLSYNEFKPKLIYCLSEEGYNNFQIIRIIKFLDENNTRNNESKV